MILADSALREGELYFRRLLEKLPYSSPTVLGPPFYSRKPL